MSFDFCLQAPNSHIRQDLEFLWAPVEEGTGLDIQRGITPTSTISKENWRFQSIQEV